ncbi:hypothetical protein EKE94_11500 [Mesobaculum littorinae]|uniref:Uncharacterized protein n=1 Tax=Mesobaculum littorinae TaxID=2486419 RepID=A0A438AHD1_9RHOB|nr:hypothetical protein [Mesobaculum littorinae]RVV98078.1 hypothetical protein EKE94_11500 [Mesobaculum littorinae]
MIHALPRRKPGPNQGPTARKVPRHGASALSWLAAPIIGFAMTCGLASGGVAQTRTDMGADTGFAAPFDGAMLQLARDREGWADGRAYSPSHDGGLPYWLDDGRGNHGRDDRDRGGRGRHPGRGHGHGWDDDRGHGGRHDRWHDDRHGGPRHGWGRPMPESLDLPRACFHRIETPHGLAEVYGTDCLARLRVRDLPSRCRTRIYAYGYPGDVYDARCLGYVMR